MGTAVLRPGSSQRVTFSRDSTSTAARRRPVKSLSWSSLMKKPSGSSGPAYPMAWQCARLPKQANKQWPHELEQHRPETAGSLASGADQMHSTDELDVVEFDLDESLVGRRRSTSHLHRIWEQTPEQRKCTPKAVYSGSPYAAPVLGSFLVRGKAEAETLMPAPRASVKRPESRSKLLARRVLDIATSGTV